MLSHADRSPGRAPGRVAREGRSAFDSERHARVAGNALVWQTLVVQYFASGLKWITVRQCIGRSRSGVRV